MLGGAAHLKAHSGDVFANNVGKSPRKCFRNSFLSLFWSWLWKFVAHNIYNNPGCGLLRMGHSMWELWHRWARMVSWLGLAV